MTYAPIGRFTERGIRERMAAKAAAERAAKALELVEAPAPVALDPEPIIVIAPPSIELDELSARLRKLTAEVVQLRSYKARTEARTAEAGRAASLFVSKKSIMQIAKRICRATGVDLVDVIAQARQKRVVTTRHAIMYWAARLTGLSYPHIGRRLGNRDHTTVLHAVRTYPDRRRAMGRHLRHVRGTQDHMAVK